MKNINEAVIFWWHYGKKYSLFIVLLATAAVFRYTQIENLPGGLFPDEAANGLDINSILNGDRQPFYERGNGREALFFYMIAPAVMLFGRTPLAHHLVSATVSLLVVLFTFLLVRRWFGSLAGFVAAFLAAVSSWYVTMSRTAFRANLTPLFALLFFYFATRVAQAKSRADYYLSAILAGSSFALGFYTYISYRMMVPVLFITFVGLIIIDFRRTQKWQIVKKYWRGFLAGVASSILTILPLALYFIKHPEFIVGRSGQVSIFSDSLNNGDVIGTFLEVVGKTIMAFFTEGALNWRHNVSGFPFLSFLISPFFLLGLILVLTQAALFVIYGLKKAKNESDTAINLKRLPFFVIALWFLFMTAPEILTAEGIPHGLRLIGIIPAVFIIPALFINEIVSRPPHERNYSRFGGKFMVNTALGILLVAEMFYGMYAYFGIAANSPDYDYAFRADLTTVSKYLNERNNKEQTYLVIDLFSEQTPRYMTTETNQPYQIVDPSSLWRGPAEVKIEDRPDFGLSLKPGDQVIFSQSTIHDTQAFERYYPAARLVKKEYNRFNEVIMKVYEQP
ncbi:MAG: hypothetical protein A3J48_00440 [Candidatus Doudnabacteria bacterium RIFCSPHIGHO2_02_FULL_46_11]|uniref:Glycosyltransferase RgtA/B/C/D-like domain-containing protein n=1 Tax=Candidatus Doudnabacteria bacterium RIFCSPHIGHO2_02_FULL_46_11 TaxID=1817832 RepID=A0A1F5P4X7_9BACT|nr:MAG: hypothetical protein A3J48_00440 [Candidatus Doudnabacteria bacterium RIFCSPHIGHO2_02_FULL_46_11]